MRINPAAILCDCGNPVKPVGNRGSYTCETPGCAHHGRVYRVEITRKVEAARPAVAPRREEYFDQN